MFNGIMLKYKLWGDIVKKALIVVDFQNDFVVGTLGFKGAEQLEDIIENKINDYLKNNNDILFTLDTHYDNYAGIYTEERHYKTLMTFNHD